MANTYIKAGQFSGVIGNGTSGYFLISNGDGTMSWIPNIINPSIINVDYPGAATAADPAGGESITLTGTGFQTGATVTIGGTAAPSVSYVSSGKLTITTPAKVAGEYDIVVTNTDTGSATYVNGISYNGLPTWTTAAGSLGTFPSGATISTITLQASEPDAGTITFNITNGALPTGLSLTGANIDGTTSILNADTLYTFTVTATDDENQATTPRTFTITVKKEIISSENFTINTYTGNGSTQSISGNSFQPDLIWFKERNGGNSHQLYDSVRGDDFALYSDQASAQYNYSTHPNGNLSPSITSDGFTTPAVTNNGINRSGGTYVAWQWKAGGAAVSNTDGNIDGAVTVSANQDAGFSIVRYSGTRSTHTVGHGLSSAPEIIFIKGLSGATPWGVYHKDLSSGYILRLNEAFPEASNPTCFTTTPPTNTIFNLGSSTIVQNGTSNQYIAYCFHSVDGYQKVGSYAGGPQGGEGSVIDCGFAPRFVMIKNITVGNEYGWNIFDSVRPSGYVLFGDAIYSETNYSSKFQLTSSGFTFLSNTPDVYWNGHNFIYLAIA